MSPGVQVVSPAMPAEAAWELMRQRNVHHLLVTEAGRLEGIVSARDLGGPKGASVRRDRSVADVMTRHVVTAQPMTTIRQAANIMRGRSIGCLAVTDGNALVGIITVTDLLDLLGRGVERPVEMATRWTLKHRAPHRKQAGASRTW